MCGSVTDMAQKISEVREERDAAVERAAELTEDIEQVRDVTLRHHDDNHTGVFRYCDNPVCKLVSTLDFEVDERWYL